ncbi:MAG: hypothetical protein JWO96_582 [Candidatus Saccharibacteria bacterium]|nr:hypothetical protein [Candidatus Saccharibacteria bacterium]
MAINPEITTVDQAAERDLKRLGSIGHAAMLLRGESSRLYHGIQESGERIGGSLVRVFEAPEEQSILVKAKDNETPLPMEYIFEDGNTMRITPEEKGYSDSVIIGSDGRTAYLGNLINIDEKSGNLWVYGESGDTRVRYSLDTTMSLETKEMLAHQYQLGQ